MVQPGSHAPTFLLLGAAKCGTTSLAYYLSQHPSVFFSEPKEPTFFEAEWEQGLDHYWRRYFAGWSGQPAIGEGRVWNLYLPFVPARIREALPGAKLVALLRDPVERVYSHWWHRYSQGQETLDFARAIAEDRARIERGEGFAGEEGARRWREGLKGDSTRHRALLDLGFYAEQLERYLSLYPAAQLEIVFHEDLVADLRGVMHRLCAFLGVDPGFAPADADPRNVGRERVRSPGARRVERTGRSLGLGRLVPRALRPKLRSLLFERTGRRPPLDPGLCRELRVYYDSHNARLERLTGRDLSAWRERRAAG